METKHSLLAASKIVRKGREKLRKMMESGELAYAVEDGKRVIDSSELIRVFGDDGCDFSILETSSRRKRKKTKHVESKPESPSQPDVFDRERRQLEARIEDLKETITSERQTRKLLEDQTRKADEWKAAMAEMKQDLANDMEERLAAVVAQNEQERKEREAKQKLKLREAEQRIKSLQGTLQREQNKSWYERLFSRSSR